MDKSLMHIHCPSDEEFEEIIGYEVEVDSIEWNQPHDTRQILLTRGDRWQKETDDRIEFRGNDQQQAVLIDSFPEAVGYFLHGCEIHGIPREIVKGDVGGVWDEWSDWASGFDLNERRIRLIDIAEDRTYDDLTQKYIEIGKWRSQNLSESGEKLTEEIARTCEMKPSMCYWTVQNMVKKFKDNHRVSYVEGIVLPGDLSQCIRHTWLEMDGEVAEMTWPWHPFDGGDAVYYGIEIDKDEVIKTRERRDVNGPIIVEDDEVGKPRTM